MKIKICKDGPYMVSGNVPLYHKSIIQQGRINVLQNMGQIKTEGEYALCRCGKSKNAPFCDGTHEAVRFDGTETADRRPYAERAELMEGIEVDLLDDDRCAFARFCHREHGSVWELTEYGSTPELAREAMEGASQCPTGRLVSVLKDGQQIEPELEPSISIVQDPQRRVSAGIFVAGNIPMEGADGQQYEVRNRMALCRCGKSENKPFCDAVHVTTRYHDK